MAEYIEREAALKVLCDACGNAACPKGLIPRCSYYEKMQSIPTADVASGRDYLDCRNELCLYCGKYKERHNGACDGCRWKEARE